MKIEMMAIKLLKPYENNPRLNAKAIPQVMKSLTEFGWRQPIVVDKDLVVIVGHTRLAAAKKMKLKQVPVHVADLTEAQVRAYRIADNRSHDRSEWDMPLLSAELDTVFGLDVRFDLEFMDFSLEELIPPAPLLGGKPMNPDEKLDRFLESSVRVIKLAYTEEEYSGVMAFMNGLCKYLAIENNSDLVAYLVRNASEKNGVSPIHLSEADDAGDQYTEAQDN